MSFHVGQHVICVCELEKTRPYGEALPRKGVVYTVRGVVFRDERCGLLVEEIVNEPHNYPRGFVERAFSAKCFRPLSSDRLAIFRQHLAPSPTDKVEA